MKLISLGLVLSILMITTPTTLAFRTDSTYGIEMLVKKGEKTKEADTSLLLQEDTFSVTPKKKSFKEQAKTFNYADIKVADYSYAKKPLFSTGGAVASVILLGVFALPFLFMKKKRHWLSVRTEDDFAVLKLQKSNFRQIIAEFETRGVKISTVEEDENKKDKKKKKKDKNEEDNQGEDAASDDTK